MNDKNLLEHLNQFTNTLIVASCALGKLVRKLLQEHKDNNIKIPFNEKREWNNIIWASKYFRVCAVDRLTKDELKQFDDNVELVSFLLLELIAKCDSNDSRLWKFHNLLKCYPTTFGALQPTIDDELSAFESIFIKASNDNIIDDKG